MPSQKVGESVQCINYFKQASLQMMMAHIDL